MVTSKDELFDLLVIGAGLRAGPTDRRAQECVDLKRGRPPFEGHKPNDEPGCMIHHDCDPPGEGPPLELGNGIHGTQNPALVGTVVRSTCQI